MPDRLARAVSAVLSFDVRLDALLRMPAGPARHREAEALKRQHSDMASVICAQTTKIEELADTICNQSERIEELEETLSRQCVQAFGLDPCVN